MMSINRHGLPHLIHPVPFQIFIHLRDAEPPKTLTQKVQPSTTFGDLMIIMEHREGE